MLVSVHRSGESANTVRLLTSHIDGEEVGTCVDVSRIDGDIQHVQGIEQRGACLMYGNHFRDSKLLLLIFHINKGRDGFVCLYSISKVGWLTSHMLTGEGYQCTCTKILGTFSRETSTLRGALGILSTRVKTYYY